MAQEADNPNGLPDPEETLGQRLKAARLNAGWEQSQVAQHLEVHKVTVSKWERDIQTPGADYLLELASFYGVGLRHLLRGDPVTDNVSRGTSAPPTLRERGDPWRALRLAQKYVEIDLIEAGAPEEVTAVVERRFAEFSDSLRKLLALKGKGRRNFPEQDDASGRGRVEGE